MGKSELVPTAKAELITTEFKALVPGSKIATTLQENLGHGGISPFDLDRVRVPSGGGQIWEVPSLTGIETQKELTGIIIYFKEVRAYWAKPFGGGTPPPDCSSTDGITGIGLPGGSCAVCPFKQFGSSLKQDGTKGRGQACKQAMMVFLLRRGDYLPMLIVLPPTSAKDCRKYMLQLANKNHPYYQVVTKIGLKKQTNPDGIAYSSSTFALDQVLTEDLIPGVMAVRTSLSAIFASAQVLEADVVGSE